MPRTETDLTKRGLKKETSDKQRIRWAGFRAPVLVVEDHFIELGHLYNTQDYKDNVLDTPHGVKLDASTLQVIKKIDEKFANARRVLTVFIEEEEKVTETSIRRYHKKQVEGIGFAYTIPNGSEEYYLITPKGELKVRSYNRGGATYLRNDDV